jgi:hypothetical protein
MLFIVILNPFKGATKNDDGLVEKLIPRNVWSLVFDYLKGNC